MHGAGSVSPLCPGWPRRVTSSWLSTAAELAPASSSTTCTALRRRTISINAVAINSIDSCTVSGVLVGLEPRPDDSRKTVSFPSLYNVSLNAGAQPYKRGATSALGHDKRCAHPASRDLHHMSERGHHLRRADVVRRHRVARKTNLTLRCAAGPPRLRTQAPATFVALW